MFNSRDQQNENTAIRFSEGGVTIRYGASNVTACRRSLRRSDGRGQGVSNNLSDLIKHLWLMNGEFAECLAVQFQVGKYQTMDEARVRQTTHFGGGLQSNDPQRAEFPLAIASIA